MAISEECIKNQAYAVVNNGSSSSGSPQYVTDSLGTLSTDTDEWSASKARAIAVALAPLLGEGTLYRARRVGTFDILDI